MPSAEPGLISELQRATGMWGIRGRGAGVLDF